MSESIAKTMLDRARMGDLDGYAKAIASIPVQSLNTIGRLPAFRESVAALVPIATGGDPTRCLRALALIGRADSTTQQKEEPIAEAARAAVRKPPPQSGAEAQRELNPDDRYYIALVVGRANATWVSSYAARALIDEGGEPRLKNDVRKTYAELLLARADTLGGAFRQIAEAVPGSLLEDPRTKDTELSRARRQAKLLTAIEEATRSALCDNGDALAADFNTMMQALVFRYGRPRGGNEADEVAAGVVESALMLLSTLLRTRFLISVEIEAYKTVGRLKYWHKTDGWPKVAAAARRRLAQTLLQAIALRARTGSASGELVSVLVQLTGDRRPVETQLARLADDSGIPTQVQEWLRAGGRVTAPKFETDAAEEASLRDVDTLVAGAALRARHVRTLSDTEGKGALEKIRNHAELASAIQSLVQMVNHSRALAADVATIARRRLLSVFGTPGELVEAVPKRHQHEDGRMIVTEMVQIERPGVERILPNGASEIILPAIVSEVESKRK